MGGAFRTYRGDEWRIKVKPKESRRLARPRHRWEDDIKMNVQENEGGMGWIYLAQDRDRWWAVVTRR